MARGGGGGLNRTVPDHNIYLEDMYFWRPPVGGWVGGGEGAELTYLTSFSLNGAYFYNAVFGSYLLAPITPTPILTGGHTRGRPPFFSDCARCFRFPAPRCLAGWGVGRQTTRRTQEES